MKLLLTLAAGAAMLLAGCSAPSDPNAYEDQLVVNAHLLGGEPIDSVYIEHTGPVTQLYTEESAAITNATVIISGNNFSDTLVQDPAKHGRYRSVHRENIIRPGSSYALTVHTPGYPDAAGATTVPDTFSVTNSGAFPTTIGYRPTAVPLAVAWSPSAHFADYLVVIRSVDLTSGQIQKNFPGDNVPERTMVGFFLQEANQSEISWLYFNYYGRTQISVVAVDDNYFDYMKQAMAAQGASDIRKIRYRLGGAIGVFGSETIAKNRIELNVTP